MQHSLTISSFSLCDPGVLVKLLFSYQVRSLCSDFIFAQYFLLPFLRLNCTVTKNDAIFYNMPGKDTSYWHRKIMLDPVQQALKQETHVIRPCHTILKVLDPLSPIARLEQRPWKVRHSLICFWSFDYMSWAWVSLVKGKMQNAACSGQVADRSWGGCFGEDCSVSCDLWAQAFVHMLFVMWLFIFCLRGWYMKFDTHYINATLCYLENKIKLYIKSQWPNCFEILSPMP